MISRIIKEENVRRLRDLLADASHIAIICHVGPDGDAIGSSLALAHVLGTLGKEARCIIPDATSALLMQLPEAKELVDACKHPDFARTLLADADLIFCLDFNEPKRVDRMADALLAAKAPKVMIDHHENPSDFATVTISHPEMAATCYLLFRVLCRLELLPYVDATAATQLLAGILTDTGGLSYNSSDPELFVVVAELLRHGADKNRLYKLLFNTVSENSLRLNAYAIDRKMEVNRDMGAALITLSRAELNRYHYSKGDTESLVNRPLAIPGVIYSCFMREEERYIKVSMRSTGDFPVNEICAEHFGGGGHINAAGGEFHGTLEEAAEAFRSLMAENKKKYINKKQK